MERGGPAEPALCCARLSRGVRSGMIRLGYATPSIVARAVRIAEGLVTNVDETIAEETPITLT